MRLHRILALLATVVMVGCEGPTGPAGPQGDAGPDGPTGPQGPVGNANVITGSVTLADSAWSTDFTHIELGVGPGSVSFGTQARYVDITVPDITNEVIMGGAVLVYMQTSPDRSPVLYDQLPYRFLYSITPEARHYAHEIRLESIRLLFFREDLDDPGATLDPLASTQPTRIFRWVIIPPAAAGVLAGLEVDAGADALIRDLERRGFTVRSDAAFDER